MRRVKLFITYDVMGSVIVYGIKGKSRGFIRSLLIWNFSVFVRSRAKLAIDLYIILKIIRN